jgi:transposase
MISMATGCGDNIIGDVLSNTIPFIRLLYLLHPAAQALYQLYGVKQIMAKNLSTIKSPNTAKEKRVKAKYIELMNPYVAGIDIGSRSHFVAAPMISEESHEIVIREFSSFTPDLHALADWLKECKVTSVAMESTGVYWIPLYELLESRGFDVNLVDARHVKNVTGRKTDVKDCQWLQQLHASGLLSPAFRPADEILPLRSYMRQREELIKASATSVQHMQKAMSQMNLHLSNVLSDIAGLTGMQIIRAIVAGVRDPKKLAEFRDRRCKQPQEVIERSLTGNYRPEHLFSLQQALETFDFYQKHILECDKQIETTLARLTPSPIDVDRKEKSQISCLALEAPRTDKRNGNLFYFNPLEFLQTLNGVDVTKIPGIEANLAVKILSEIGTDMMKWKSEKHFTSWLGLSPENKVSGGKQLSSRTKTCSNRAAECFRLAAFSLYQSKTALGAFLRRIKAKHGAPKAITATARKIAAIFYSMLTKGTEYVEAGLHCYEERYKEHVLKGLQKRAQELGYMLAPISPTDVQQELAHA